MHTRTTAPRFARRTVTVLALITLCAAPLGCRSIQQRQAVIPELVHPVPSEIASTELSELWLDWWPEITTQSAQASAAPGPSLIAGDWLAWQCAHAGGYFESSQSSFALGSE